MNIPPTSEKDELELIIHKLNLMITENEEIIEDATEEEKETTTYKRIKEILLPHLKKVKAEKEKLLLESH